MLPSRLKLLILISHLVPSFVDLCLCYHHSLAPKTEDYFVSKDCWLETNGEGDGLLKWKRCLVYSFFFWICPLTFLFICVNFCHNSKRVIAVRSLPAVPLIEIKVTGIAQHWKTTLCLTVLESLATLHWAVMLMQFLEDWKQKKIKNKKNFRL